MEEHSMYVRDPVCGTRIDLADVAASEDRGGWAYFFCSHDCRRTFLASPGKFAQPAASAGTDFPPAGTTE